MTDGHAQDWDPRDAAVLEDQRAAYDGMRERCPVAHSEFLGCSLFRHSDVVRVVSDPGTFTSATKRLAIPNGMDPPEHTVYRAALEPYFAPERMAAFEPRSRQLASALLDQLVGRGELQAIEAFVNPFAHQALCAFMGWPVEHWNRINDWTHGNQEAAFRQDRDSGAALAREFATYVTEILGARRADGSTNDLMAELIQTTVNHEPLTDDQIVSALRTWTAGHGTVAAALGIVLRYLAEHPDLQDRLRAEPALLDHAIAEILRTDGPLIANNRTSARDVQIGGRAIGAGDRISLMWIAANRDPATFADADRVDVDRDPADNLLFGAGIHRCLGEPLARLNLRVGVDELLRRTSRFELAGSEPPVRQLYPSNGLSSLWMRLAPANPPGELTPEADGRRQSPRERFAGKEHVFDVEAIAAGLRNESYPVRDGHRQMTVFHKGSMALVVFAFDAGGQLVDHRADAYVTIMALSGRLEVSTPNQTHHLPAGSLLVLDPGMPHDVHAPEESEMLLVVGQVGGDTPTP